MRTNEFLMATTMETQKPERLDWRTLMKAADDTPPKVIAALDKYFSQFVAVPLKNDENGKPQMQTQQCVGCGESLTGFLGTWRWAIAHGVGECARCHWPSLGHHSIKDDDGEELLTLHNFVLQIHPDFVQRKQRVTA
jgi:hypothetical protein